MWERRIAKAMSIFVFLAVLYASITRTHAADTVSVNQIVRYNETIISPLENFELGFFNPGNSTNHYVGIWYKKISTRTIVWVANRNRPLTDTSDELTLTLEGVLVLREATKGHVVWSSSNSSTTSVGNPVCKLLDNGNFIIYEEGDGFNQEDDPIWQSFDFPTDTLLPGMKHGWNFVTGTERYYTSWKSNDDPATGDFTNRIDSRGYPQVILSEGKEIKFRGGPWNGLRFTGTPNLRPNEFYNFTFVLNQREIYYQYNLIDTSVITRVVLQSNGRLERLLWIDSKQEWNLYLARQHDLCDQYAVCGPNGSCDIGKSPVCECLKGFEPVSPLQWKITDWSQGCRHTIPLDCKPGEGFNKYSNLKLPDTRASWYNQTMTLVECERMCKGNCSCTAYTTSNISETGSGCLLWFGGLVDVRTMYENGDTLYIRLSASELVSIEGDKTSTAGRRIQVIVPLALEEAPTARYELCFTFNTSNPKQGTRSGVEELELPHFRLSAILKATDNFSINNKLGEGGFGPVYKPKCILIDGRGKVKRRFWFRTYRKECRLVSYGWSLKSSERCRMLMWRRREIFTEPKGVKDVWCLLNELNMIKIRDAKVGVTVARFDKWQGKADERREEPKVTHGQRLERGNVSGVSKGNVQSGRSYKEAAMVGVTSMGRKKKVVALAKPVNHPPSDWIGSGGRWLGWQSVIGL
ncbi:S-locus-specific glycoprotein S13-like [Bidens hawaiensis]|uniref:S-locus-specific glycoprotein S13-like n=1 Tax=Bidens hawaiensis TaxID=980011 RepID=UPI00404966E7